jgi:uncharacterized membrane protein YkoI
MNQRSALLIAAALTAFLLVLAGGLASRLSATPDLVPTEVAVISTEMPPPTEVITLDPTVEALIKEREAAYQQALAEANSRLNQANDQIAQANSQISSLEQSRQQLAEQANQISQSQAAVVSAPVTVAAAAAPTAAPTAAPIAASAPTYAISVDQARDIALGVAATGATLQKTPDLVNYQGTPAYEVVLDKGSVYVDAQSGAVLWNGAAAPQLISQDQAIQSAQAYLGGGTVKSVTLRDENGAQTYEVQFSDDSKVYVDAITGVVVYAEIRTTGTQSASSGNSSSGGEHEDDDDDESGEHGDDDEHESGEHGGDD